MKKKWKNRNNSNIPVLNTVIEEQVKEPSSLDAKNNRTFDVYDYPELEACSKNSDKRVYNRNNLTYDLAYFIRYLTIEECNFVTNVIFWLLAEAIKNYGYVSLDHFGRFVTNDVVTKTHYQPWGQKKYTNPYYRLNRQLTFKPAKYLKSLITPIDLHYTNLYDMQNYMDVKYAWPSFFDTFAYAKKHRRLGQLFVQEAVNKQYMNTPYSQEYLRALAIRDIFDATRYF